MDWLCLNLVAPFSSPHGQSFLYSLVGDTHLYIGKTRADRSVLSNHLSGLDPRYREHLCEVMRLTSTSMRVQKSHDSKKLRDFHHEKPWRLVMLLTHLGQHSSIDTAEKIAIK